MVEQNTISFGKKIDVHCSFGAKRVLECGFDPGQYYDWVAKAISEEGKEFGKFFARGMPGALEHNVEVEDYWVSLLTVYKSGARGKAKRALINSFNKHAAKISGLSGASIIELGAAYIDVFRERGVGVATRELSGISRAFED